MAINPPSDIVMDVVNAADPTRMEVAQTRLRAGQAANEAQRLASTDKAFDASVIKNHVRSNVDAADATKTKIPETYRKFEAMVMQNMLKSMIPDSEEIYGKGATGEIWKGMMAEQLANEISKNGGIGIAEQLSRHGTTAVRTHADAEHNRGDRLHMATQLIDGNQMKVLDKLVIGADAHRDDA